jgi:hypothetical protein
VVKQQYFAADLFVTKITNYVTKHHKQVQQNTMSLQHFLKPHKT